MAGGHLGPERLVGASILSHPLRTVPHMRPDRLLRRLRSGAYANVRFRDAQRLVEALGFRLLRTSGSHHIYGHDDLPELLNLQRTGAQAKPYQLRQIMALVDQYNLTVRPR